MVTFFGLAEGRDQLYIVTEFMADGSLDKHLIQNSNRYARAQLKEAAGHMSSKCCFSPKLPSLTRVTDVAGSHNVC